MDDAVTEYSTRMGTGYLVRGPEAARVYPLAEWIEDKRGDGSKVYRRRIVVIEDWTEVDAP